MKQYVCKNCGTQLDIDSVSLKANCPNCGSEFYLVDIETAPVRKRLYELIINRSYASLSFAVDVKELANKILEKNDEDAFAKFYFALAERIMGNSAYYRDFLGYYRYSPELDAYNGLILRDLIANVDGEFLDETAQHFRRTIDSADLLARSLDELKIAARYNEEKKADYVYAPRDVFVCHAFEDTDIALEIAAVLKRTGISTWIAAHNVRPNSLTFWQDVYQGVFNCRLFLVLTSRDALVSEDCLKQINIAANLAKARKEFRLDTSTHNLAFEDFFEGEISIDGTTDPKNAIVSAVAQIRASVSAAREAERAARTGAEAEAAEKLRTMQQKQRELERLAEFIATGARGLDSDADVMRTSLMYAARAKFDEAAGLSIRLKHLSPDSPASLLTDISVSLYRLPHLSDEGKAALMPKIKQYVAAFKQKFPVQSLGEKETIEKLGDSEVYALLATTLYSIGEKVRRDHVVTLIKPQEVYDRALSLNYLAMLYREKNYREVRRFLMNSPVADPSTVFVGILNNYDDASTKKELLSAFSQRNEITDTCMDAVSRYFASTEDNVPVLLEVLSILSRNGLAVSTEVLRRTRLGDIRTVDHMMAVLENLENKSITSSDVDALMQNVEDDCPESLASLISFLQTRGIHDIGQNNVKKLAAVIMESREEDRLPLTKLLLEFAIDPATKDSIVRTYLQKPFQKFENKEAVFNILAMHPALITVASYEPYVLSSVDTPINKLKIVKKLADMTIKFSAASSLISRYMANSSDPAAIKEQIANYFVSSGFGCGDDALASFVRSSIGESNHEQVTRDYLMRNPSAAPALFAELLQKNRLTNNARLASIFIERISSVTKELLLTFLVCYNDESRVKSALFLDMIRKTSALKEDYELSFNGGKITVNLLQAFALFLKEETQESNQVTDYLRQKGIKATEKLIATNGKKTKPQDFLRETTSVSEAGRRILGR